MRLVTFRELFGHISIFNLQEILIEQSKAKLGKKTNALILL